MQLVRRHELRWGTEPIAELDRIPIHECEEPLVNACLYHDRIIALHPAYERVRSILVRNTVARMLSRAQDMLGDSYRLKVWDGFRPRRVQERLYARVYARMKEKYPHASHALLRRKTNKWVAPPDSRSPPGHTTGGAVDVILCRENGRRVDCVSPFTSRDERAHPTFAHGLSPRAMHHRIRLYHAMTNAGFANYSQEWWHYSYGDNGWAWRMKRTHAIYDEVRKSA